MELNKLLRKHWTFLIENSTNYSEILSRLFAQQIISKGEKQTIENRLVNMTEFDIYDSLYSTIIKKNLDEETLKDILKASSNEHIVKLIWNSNQIINEVIISLEENFNAATDKVRNLKTKPNDNELLKLYGLYRQITVGNVDIARPGMLDLKGKARWDAWKDRKGMDQNEAKTKYIKFVDGLVTKYGMDSK